MNRLTWFQWCVFTPILFAVSFYISACGGPVEAVEPSPSIIVFGDDFVASGANKSTSEVKWIGHNNATTGNLLQATPDIASRQPAQVYIMGGIVDFIDKQANVSETLARYLQIVEQLTAQGIKVTTISILYVAREVNTLNVNPEALNAQITSFNTQLKTFCNTGECQFLDANAAMSYDGFLEEGYAMPDGVYLNGAALHTFAALIMRDVNDGK